VRLLSTYRTHKLNPFHHKPGKAITLQEVEVSRISGMSVHKGSKFDSPRHRPPLPHRKHPCYSFLLEGDSTLGILGRVGHRAARRIKYVESNYTIRYRNRNPQACIAVPQPPATPPIPIYQLQ
jgi:hypothetical protein